MHLEELENFGLQTRPLRVFKVPSLVKGGVIVANWSRQELRDSVSQTRS